MNIHSINPFELFKRMWSSRDLISQMTKREVTGRYRGSVLGLFWSFFHPVIMLAIYTFVFSVVFNARWGGGSGSRLEFALILFAGLIVFNLFAECVTRAPTLVTGNVNYVKRVVFPLEILPLVAMGAALFHGAVSLLVLLTFYVISTGIVHWTLVFLPLVILPLVLTTIGLCWFLSALGVFYRDVSQAVSLIVTMMMFLSPIFYPVSALPENYRVFVYANPLAIIIEQLRGIAIRGEMPSWTGLLVSLSMSVFIAWLGLIWFQKTRRGFADVL